MNLLASHSNVQHLLLFYRELWIHPDVAGAIKPVWPAKNFKTFISSVYRRMSMISVGTILLSFPRLPYFIIFQTSGNLH